MWSILYVSLCIYEVSNKYPIKYFLKIKIINFDTSWIRIREYPWSICIRYGSDTDTAPFWSIQVSYSGLIKCYLHILYKKCYLHVILYLIIIKYISKSDFLFTNWQIHVTKFIWQIHKKWKLNSCAKNHQFIVLHIICNVIFI